MLAGGRTWQQAYRERIRSRGARHACWEREGGHCLLGCSYCQEERFIF